MDKFKKIGLTALGTSLVAGSAFAADATVTGNAGYTWSSEEVGTSTTDGIGFENDMKMVISGELDNGWSVTGSMLLAEDASLSSSWTSLTMGSMGSIVVGNGYGGLGANHDDATPRAYEENHDGMKTATAIDSIGSAMDNGQILYTSPSFDIMGASVSFGAEYAPEASDTAISDGGVSTSSNLWSSGKGAQVNVAYGGLSWGAYVNERTKDSANSVTDGDASDATWHASYTTGPVSFGYQVGMVERGITGAAAANNSSAKTVTEANGNFDIEKMSIAFNVNDNFSVSWGELTETYDEQGGGGAGTTAVPDVDMSSTSIQFSYTMGSMTIAGYQTDTDNPGWDSDAKSDTVNEIAINFAF